MRRFVVTVTAYILLALGFIGATGTVQAQAAVTTLASPWSIPTVLSVEPIVPADELLKQVRSQVLPQLKSILRPEQRDQLQAEVVEAKISLRKAFKKIARSSDQKTKLARVFKSLPKDVFASLTPEQKQELFANEGMFKPTPEAISEKITAKMQMAKDKGAMLGRVLDLWKHFRRSNQTHSD